jgi:hypothetical protein
MSERHIVIRGESFVTLSTVAEFFEVQVAWVREVYEAGLLGPGERVGEELAIPATELDRVATIQRLHRHYGVDLELIEFVLERRFGAG